ncbi:N-acetyl-gamma-glutamyl-phosphate reductase [bacterium (Candidatus Gribaldobacteria) CG_4_10_14_0_2_um_filter_36_18]|uniref:N-acetyl-gamma-glutamyl-phosphate reductase n=1 Tax=bacterium (Candidatus Gribaldobacteria) CG_4_10_14_0_2_um_filter_36_18 TaxID=2014264 RepID=A0A2M7VJN2_9BACT|nr:MAG: N-acetyl-gamma-glutamyl-phosphate reductase [bacterium (Candidatus Gribaldobacteria) CG_4_10_14_0_2_um_filter_36_18]
MIKVVIIGGSGYVGGELLRFLLFHPQVKIIGVSSHSSCGEKISNIHSNLKNITDLIFQKENIEKFAQQADVIFFAIPAGESMKKIKKIDLSKTKVIDLGADFRIQDVKIFEETYKIKHQSSDLLEKAVYGLPEINKEAIKKAFLVACPGCFSTGALIALYPLAKHKMLTGPVVIDSKTGSSGSGIKPSVVTHHPERAYDFKAYNIFSHRHMPEISQTLSQFQNKKVDLVFTPHSTSMVRGIFTTAYVFMEKEIDGKNIKQIFAESYESSPFVRFVDQSRCAVVAGTNYCDLAVYTQGKKVVITTAIDNLVKGAAGQAIQNMNLMFNLPEQTGLQFPGMHP